LVPHYLSGNEFGQLAVVLTVTTLAGAIASLGVYDFLKRRVARDPNCVTTDASAALLLLVALSVLVAAVLLATLPALGVVSVSTQVLGLALAGMIIQTTQGVLFAVLVGQEHHGRFAWISAIGTLAAACGMVAGLALGGGLSGCLLASTLISGAMTVILWRVSGFRFVFTLRLPLMWEIAHGGLPFLGWNVARLVRAQIAVILVGVLLEAQAAGLLAAAYRIIGAIVFIPTVVTTPLLPVLSREARNPAVFQRTLRRSLITVLTLTLPACGMIIALAPAIPGILHWSPSFQLAVPLMTILAVQQPLVAADMVLGTALIALGGERRWLKVMVVAAVYNPVVNLAIIPVFESIWHNGAMGAAVVEITTEVLMFGGALILLPRGLLDWSTARAAVRIVTTAACVTIAASVLRDVWLPAALLAGGAAFAISGGALGVLRLRDIWAVRQVAFQAFARRGASAS
jgi:O-antigen/teichoic acid export membrane protein